MSTEQFLNGLTKAVESLLPPERMSEAEYIDTLGDEVSLRASQGLVLDVDPDVADQLAAFPEDALDPAEARESRFDLVSRDDEEGQL